MKLTILLIATASLSLFMISCKSSRTDEALLREFVANHVKEVVPKITAQNIADWNANATGEKKYYDESAALDLEVKRIRSSKSAFAFSRI